MACLQNSPEQVDKPFVTYTPPHTFEKQPMMHRIEVTCQITFDNGMEFARHSLIKEALNMTTWFCDAYASWQKGGVENMNGRLRRDLPRHLDIDAMNDEDFADINLMHNLTPRKCLGFKTPMQALLSNLGIDAKLSFHRGVALQI